MRRATILLVLLALWVPSVVAGRPGDDPWRLDAGVAPTFEALRLRIDPDGPDYRGTVEIELRAARAVEGFRFHADALELDQLELEGDDGPLELTYATRDHGLVAVTTAEPLTPQATYRLRVAFHNDLGTRAVSLYRTDIDGRGYVFSQFQPDEARRAFPCWDEPGFKIPFRVVVEAPATQTVVSNTPVESERVDGAWKTVTFRETPPLPTYLLAVAVGPFETVPIAGLSVPGRVVTVRGQRSLAGLAVATTPGILRALEAYFGRPYPYAKLDLIAVPEYWAGAMEHPGAVTYSDGILLVAADSVTAARRRSLIRVTAHELAHMWFGNLVTMRWWDDFWLNESFADWMGDKITNEIAPELQLDLAELRDLQQVMESDARPSTAPIRRPVASTDNLFQNIGLTYSKGKAVLAMFEHWMGPDRFRRGVRAYLEQKAWGNAVADDLWKALSRAGGSELSAAMTTFIAQPGLPLVRARVLGDGRLELTQSRFLHEGVRAEPLRWKIPVVLELFDGERVRRERVLLDRPRVTLDLGGTSPVWLLPNAEARGYYRWSVPEEMRTRIAADAAGRLDVAERVGLVGNLTALLESGDVAGGEFLRTLTTLAADPQPAVVGAVIDALDAVQTAFVDDELEEPFACYVRATLGPTLQRYGARARPGEAQSVALLRPRLLAWLGERGHDPAVLDRARRLADRYLKDPSSIDPALADVVLGLRALDGDRELFDLYRSRFEASEVPAERSRYLAALGKFGRPELRKAALRYALEGPLRPNELFTIHRSLPDTEAARAARYSWVKENYGAVAERVPAMVLSFMPFFADGCSAARLEDAERFFGQAEHRAPGTAERLALVADSVRDCVALRAREGESVRRFLTARQEGPARTGSLRDERDVGARERGVSATAGEGRGDRPTRSSGAARARLASSSLAQPILGWIQIPGGPGEREPPVPGTSGAWGPAHDLLHSGVGSCPAASRAGRGNPERAAFGEPHPSNQACGRAPGCSGPPRSSPEK